MVINRFSRKKNKICSKISLDSDYLVSPANLNSKNQIVISGTKEGIARAIEECKSSGAKRAIALPMRVPAHCELMKDAADKFSYILEKVRFSDPKIPVIQNVDSLVEANPEKIKKLYLQIVKEGKSNLDHSALYLLIKKLN